MASSSERSSSSFSVSGLWRRPVGSSSPTRPHSGGPPQPDIDPPPRPRPVLQLLAFVLFALLACLQFLPATHFRHPFDPLRSWIPLDPHPTLAPSTYSRPPYEEQSSDILNHEEAKKIHIFSWSNCWDLRVLAVLANSTLSSSRFPELVHFHFFVPDGEDENLSYYKLRVLFPHSNIDIIGQKEVKEKLSAATPEGELLWPIIHEVIPFIIPRINASWNKFLYVSPDIIMKGKIEELFGENLGRYAIAVAEDCSRRLGDYVNIDILNAIQRTSAKTWVSEKPYDKNACAPDLNVFLLDKSKLEKNLIEAILWWSKVLNLGNERSDQVSAAIVLALYEKYLKLSSAWKLGEPMQSKLDSKTNILRFDGPKKVCSEHHTQHQGSDFGNIWRQYLPPKSDAVLSH